MLRSQARAIQLTLFFKNSGLAARLGMIVSMKHMTFTVLLGLFLASCTAPPPHVTYVTPALTDAQNEFAIDLYGQLRGQKGNFFFAPYSVSTALGMVYAGAKGGTAAELAKTLHLDELKPAAANGLRATYLQDFAAQPVLGDTQPDGSKFETANALWGANHYNFNAGYIATIKFDFGGDLRRVNFVSPQAAIDKINNWVDLHTHGKIPSIISPIMLSGDTRLVLTNAVYFKAGWAQPFYLDATRKALFDIASGDDVQADTMDMTSELGYAADDRVQILVLDYRYGDTSMVIVLPKAKEGLPAVEAGLTLAELDSLLAARQYPLVHVTMPKFSADSTFDMVPSLQILGLKQLFDPVRCDLTGIATDPAGPIYVSLVIHKAHLDVDEVGTEAAASTAIVAPVPASAPIPQLGPPPVPIPFIANHPFLYLIRDNATGEILFMGRVVDPTD